MPDQGTSALHYLAGGGRMGALIRSMDWTQTPLGPISRWPPNLAIAAGIMVRSPQPMFMWWGPELINLYNDACASIVASRRAMSLGQPAAVVWSDVWHAIRPQVDALWSDARTESDPRPFLLLDASRSAEEGELVFGCSAVFGDAGAISGFFCTLAQVQRERDRKALLASERGARSAAERASRAKDEFLATLSHELRTPINSVLTWAQLLRSGTLDATNANLAIDAIERGIRTQVRLIDDLLDLSRITSGKLRLDVRCMDLRTAIRTAVDAVTPAANAKGVMLRQVVPSGEGSTWIRGDASRLEHVFCNLLTNAIKFTPKGGIVEVRLQRIDFELVVSVEDTGRGIARDFLPHLFERFRQADRSGARQKGGLGLGLAIVKQLVELHGGSVRAESEGPGRGSTFVVSLPSSDAAEALSEKVALCTDVDLSGTCILVVDDDDDARVAIARMLTECNATIETAASADEALERLTHVGASLLISDIGMPGKDGYELIREIRRLPGQAHLLSIALTAFARPEDRVQALQEGYDEHVSKPVDPRELLAAVASLVRGG